MSPAFNPLDSRLAIISGEGDLPSKVLKSASLLGFQGIVINLTDTDSQIKNLSEWKTFKFKIGNIGRIFKKLHLEKITHIVLCGNIDRPKLYDMKFDIKGLDIMSKIAFKGDDGALKILSKEIENEGFNIIAPSTFLRNSNFPKGHIAGPKPNDNLLNEIERGYEVLKNLSASDVGQSVVVQHGIVLAIEAIEGTDEMIKRAGKFKSSGTGPILIKTPKLNQDLRFDQPVIGINTVKLAHRHGFSSISCKYDGVLVIDLNKVIDTANHRNITLFGF